MTTTRTGVFERRVDRDGAERFTPMRDRARLRPRGWLQAPAAAHPALRAFLGSE